MIEKKALNSEQERCVSHLEGPLLVIAGAGSGKTRIITYRIAHLLSLGIAAKDILAITFTNKAADEMKKRIGELRGGQENDQVWISTFHSLGAKILRESIDALGRSKNFTIYDEDDAARLLKEVLKELSIDDKFLKHFQSVISKTKNDLRDLAELDEEEHKIWAFYDHKMRECNAVDFDDLLFLPVKLLQENEDARNFWQNRFLFLLIDEYQDTNFAQYTLAKILIANTGNLFAVGDPDQSIYSWRGARYQNIMNFKSDFPLAQIVMLEHNYRSSSTILKAANALIAKNEQRYPKNLWSTLGEGEKIVLFFAESEKKEGEFVAHEILKREKQGFSLNEIAVFYRTNAQSRVFEEAFLSFGIPFVVWGGLSFYERKEIKDVLAFLRLILSDSDLVAFQRTINLPKRGIGKATLEKLKNFSQQEKRPILDLCRFVVEHGKIPPKQKEGFQEYLRNIAILRHKLEEEAKIGDLIGEILSLFHYLRYLKEEDEESFEERQENIGSLVTKAFEWEEERGSLGGPKELLQAFLEELALIASREEKPMGPRVKLMTLHTSKGLEFDCAFMVGIEEGLFPHFSALESPSELEEERRLCYVGMTRAKKVLYLSASFLRKIWGEERFLQPSRFFKEIPQEFCIESGDREEALVTAFAKGDKVLHPMFGKGEIQSCYETSLGIAYDILFTIDSQVRTVIAQFAKLERIKD